MGTQFQSVTAQTLDLTIFPNLVRLTANGAFNQCENMTRMMLPASLTEVYQSLFGNYSGGKTVIIGNATEGSSLNTIRWHAFYYATVVLYATTPPATIETQSGATWYVPDDSLDLYLAYKAAHSNLNMTFKPISEWPG